MSLIVGGVAAASSAAARAAPEADAPDGKRAIHGAPDAGPVDGGHADFEAFFASCADAFRLHVRGDPLPYLDLWSRGDVAVLGAGGTHVEGFDRVRQHLLGASSTLDWDDVKVTRLFTSVVGEQAITVVLEDMRRGGGKQPSRRTLRATQGYRREQGVWRIVLRHGNPMTEQDASQEAALLAKGAAIAGRG